MVLDGEQGGDTNSGDEIPHGSFLHVGDQVERCAGSEITHVVRRGNGANGTAGA